MISLVKDFTQINRRFWKNIFTQMFVRSSFIHLKWSHSIWLTVSCVSRMILASNPCTTLVRSKQSIQFVLNTPSCWLRTFPSFDMAKYLKNWKASQYKNLPCLNMYKITIILSDKNMTLFCIETKKLLHNYTINITKRINCVSWF